ncbi:MAG: hypothetical protein CME63_04970 [Halobacteriovoraceae bacterium]|nr:hypothetical protein [Halobacteriovoraceae bacterium]|tara:strand:- start:80396 stop:80584 length:189 start_codon:yes stop_codon:yes gene_type:complete
MTMFLRGGILFGILSTLIFPSPLEEVDIYVSKKDSVDKKEIILEKAPKDDNQWVKKWLESSS